MKHVLAALLLHETDEEINERNLTAVLEAAGASVEVSRTKALVAALEGVDLNAVAEDGVAQLVPEGNGEIAATESEVALSAEVDGADRNATDGSAGATTDGGAAGGEPSTADADDAEVTDESGEDVADGTA